MNASTTTTTTTAHAATIAKLATQSPAPFGLFTSLPAELQDMIWEFANTQDAPRIFQWRDDFLVNDDKFAPQYSQAVHLLLAPGSQHPVVQQVCTRAREAARRSGLRSLLKPLEKIIWTWPVELYSTGLYGRHQQTALPQGYVCSKGGQGAMYKTEYHRGHLLFNVYHDVLYILDPQKLLPDTSLHSPVGTTGPKLPCMSLADVRHIAIGLPSKHIHTFTEMDWEPTLVQMRNRFKKMQTLLLVYEGHHADTVDSVTGETRDSPWVRDGCCAGGDRYEKRPAPVTALVPATSSQRAYQDWGRLEKTVQNAWDRVCSNGENIIHAEKPLNIEVRYTERDWTSRLRGHEAAEIPQTAVMGGMARNGPVTGYECKSEVATQGWWHVESATIE